MKTQKFRYKVIAMFLLFTMVIQIVSPTVAWALTSADTQPEVWGYQPVDATDNVSLASGAFNYTIPITSIPEYPMAIGYSSGMGMDQEGGMFGFGFNGFSGAISRNIMGLPDDQNDAIQPGMKYTYKSQKRWDASLKGTLSTGIQRAGIQLGVGVFNKFGFNSYTGVYGAVGTVFGASKKSPEFYGASAGIGLGGQLVSDSRQSGIGFSFGGGVSIGYSNKKGVGTSEGLLGFGISKTLDNKSSKWTSGAYLTSVFGKSLFSGTISGGTSSLAPLAYVLPTKTGFGTSASITFPVGSLFITAEGAYSQSKIAQDDPVQKKGFGFLYLNSYNRRSRDHQADFTVEGENSYSTRNSPAYLQRDYFQVNAMGMSGTMQLYQDEYGIVSRNYARDQFRTLGLLGVKTSRKEVYPWTGTTRAKLNKGVDILALLKQKDKPESKDFDNAMFDEEELTSLTASNNSFSSARFKMRGDLAGEFDMSSNDITNKNNFLDHDVNKLQLTQVPGTGSKKSFFFFGHEKNMPLYYPQFAGEDQQAFTEAENRTRKIEQGSDIQYYSVNDILSKASTDGLRTFDPTSVPAETNQSKITFPFNFNQSFYSHYTFPGTGSDQYVINNNQKPMNILKHLNDITASNPSVSSSIGAVEVRSASGLRYLFGLPAFNKKKVSLQMSGKGIKAPIDQEGGSPPDNYNSFKDTDVRERNKSITENNSPYPYAWMLTAIVGDDYIDFDNIPGPSDGDIGYWVKFKYVKASDNYHWRAPFTGLDHLPGAFHDPNDDVYTMAAGDKEIYYLSEIESAGYTCKYRLEKRYDAIEAQHTTSGIWNGAASNILTTAKPAPANTSLGQNYQFLVTKIDLYKKHNSGTNSEVRSNATPGTLIKSTRFEYDYSICPQTPNNIANYGAISKSQVPYYWSGASETNIGTGKATLRKVQHIAYNADGSSVTLPSYDFKYWSDYDASKYNPAYDTDQVDQWGHYVKSSKAPGHASGKHPDVNYYHHYTELAKGYADDNARVFNLKQIMLPSGGIMNIDYEAQDYAKVQDQSAFVMRNIRVDNYNYTDGHITISVDVTDVGNQSLEAAGVLHQGQEVMGEMLFYPESNSTSDYDESHGVLIVDKATVGSFGSVSQSGDRYYQTLTLDYVADPEVVTNRNIPFVSKFKNYIYLESPQARVLKEKISGPCGNVEELMNKYLTLEKDGPIDAARKIIANVKHAFVSDAGFQDDFNDCFGDDPGSIFYPHLSFLRTPVYKGKYTGSRVKSILLQDDFRYGTEVNGAVDKDDAENNNYGTNYFFDQQGDGTGVSAGVATIEPGGGYTCAIDQLKLNGSGFAPSPTIFSSKTTLENAYQEEGSSASNGARISRKKGKTSYEFYTPQDQGLQFQSKLKESDVINEPGKSNGHFYMFGILSFLKIKIRVFRKTFTLKLGTIIPAFVFWNRQDFYNLKSYAYTDYTDIYGRPKSIVQLDASGKAIGKQQFNYYGIDESVPVYKNGFAALNTTDRKPGKMDQSWSEAYYTKESDVNFIPWLVTFKASSNRRFSFTNMKYSYVPPVLKEVVSTLDGLTTTTTNTGFDYFTGSPIQVESNDSYTNKKIVRTVPAYWQYTQMGPTCSSSNNTNNLTATTGTYMYLNQVDNDHLLGSGIVEWKNNTAATGWGIIDYINPAQKYQSSTTFNYEYKKTDGNAIRSQYSSQPGMATAVSNNRALFRTYKGYTYEVPLNPAGTTDPAISGKYKDGTFTSFTDFSYTDNAANSTWKLLSTNELYSQNGVLVQSKDVLNKYAAQLLGYNFSNTISAVSNASWAASVFDGAENTYHNSAAVSGINPIMIENDKLKLVDAQVVSACQQSFCSRTLKLANFLMVAGHPHGNVITIKNLGVGTPVYNVPFAKIDVTFYNNISRSLYISLKDNGNYQVISNMGEDFTGFFVYNAGANETRLIFNPNDFIAGSFNLDQTFVPNGFTIVQYTVTASLNVEVFDCTVTDKPYTIPCSDCAVEAHTGSYAFRLKNGGAIGTRYELSSKNIATADEFHRKYKALVWVYNTSPNETELVVQRRNYSGALMQAEELTSKATPYATAGNWTLLRIDFDLTNANYSSDPRSTDYVSVFVRNSSKSGVSIYDDMRILPFHADMTNWVFEHKFNRVISGLDNDNFASYSDYDSRGRVSQSAVEIQSTGKTTVQKFLYNDQKPGN